MSASTRAVGDASFCSTRSSTVLVRNELTLRTRGRGCNVGRLHVERAVTDVRLSAVHERHGKASSFMIQALCV